MRHFQNTFVFFHHAYKVYIDVENIPLRWTSGGLYVLHPQNNSTFNLIICKRQNFKIKLYNVKLNIKQENILFN